MGHPRTSSGNGSFTGRVALFALAAAILIVALVVPASAHIERASYWPDPAPESIAGGQYKASNAKLKKKIKKAKAQHEAKKVKHLKRKLHKQQSEAGEITGGAVPVERPLASALDVSRPGDTHVVCPGGPGSVPKGPSKKKLAKLRAKIAAAKASGNNKRVKQVHRKIAKARTGPLMKHPAIKALKASIGSAKAHGYTIRPSQGPIGYTGAEGKKLLALNLKLLKDCQFSSIQDAVTQSGNNDRVVIMPGTYTEPKSRARPTQDPACAKLKETNDKGSTGAVSYAYQVKCPNDQSLVAVAGRALTSTPVPQPPRLDRHVIPGAGPCIRCNLQIEGSGVGPDDVVLDAGDTSAGDGGPAKPVKDVGIRADRADGLVISNLKVRHAREHGIYVMETDGYLLNRFKTFYNEEYGVLTFVSDHGVMENCDASGSGDSALYPGAAADTGEQTIEKAQRYNQEITRCDMHHSTLGYSGTDANGVWVHDNDFYENAQGFSTDVFTAPGHPGFPQDSDLVENNNFYDNNFNPYLAPCTGNHKLGPDGPNQGCSDLNPSVPVPVGDGMWIAGGNNNTVRNNHFWNNWRRGAMLFAVPDQLVCGPAGSVDPSNLAGCNSTATLPSTSYRNRFYGNVMGKAPGGAVARNGVDFWWDSFPGNTGNCWYNNGTVTSTPASLPSDCASSTGTLPLGDTELLSCFANFSQSSAAPCDWFTTPPKP